MSGPIAKVSPSLIWSPTHSYLSERIRQAKTLRILIAPFIKIDGLRQLVDICQDTTDLQVIVRWKASDILTGVSDLAIYPFLKDRRIELYTHSEIHLKLFLFNDSLAFHTSGNITAKGLGLSTSRNIEIGCEVGLTASDWQQLFRILNNSNRVDDDVYQRAIAYQAEHKSDLPPLPPLDLRPNIDKRFSRLSLPSSPSPLALYTFYNDIESERFPAEESSPFVHDLALYEIPPKLSKDEFFQLLKEKFIKHAFISAIVALIKAERTARFGLVNEWITANCSDKPIPYRWEMKSATRRLYDWLTYFFKELSWDVPGSHSMVIRWNETTLPSM